MQQQGRQLCWPGPSSQASWLGLDSHSHVKASVRDMQEILEAGLATIIPCFPLKLARHSQDASDLQTLLFSAQKRKNRALHLDSCMWNIQLCFSIVSFVGIIALCTLLPTWRLFLVCPALGVRTLGTVCHKIWGPKPSSKVCPNCNSSTSEYFPKYAVTIISDCT